MNQKLIAVFLVFCAQKEGNNFILTTSRRYFMSNAALPWQENYRLNSYHARPQSKLNNQYDQVTQVISKAI